MKYLLIVAMFFSLLSVSQAEMKCAPGKCGSAMGTGNKMKVKEGYSGNGKQKAVDIKAGEYRCATCKMDVNDLDYAVQIATSKGDTYFFDDIGCAVVWLGKHPQQKLQMYVRTLDTHQWSDATKAWYSRTSSSPMRYGFGAFTTKKEGRVSYEKMKELIVSGETLRNPVVRKKLLSP